VSAVRARLYLICYGVASLAPPSRRSRVGMFRRVLSIPAVARPRSSALSVRLMD
jgi:hypothetical protein